CPANAIGNGELWGRSSDLSTTRPRISHATTTLQSPARFARGGYHRPMFTGLVEELGTVHVARPTGDPHGDFSLRLIVKSALVTKDTRVGDSVAVNGCCLTVVKRSQQLLAFDA